MLIQLVSRLLTEDPNQRLGARGASEVIVVLLLVLIKIIFISFPVHDFKTLIHKLIDLNL